LIFSKFCLTILILFFLNYCRSEHESFLEDVNQLLAVHKYEKALTLIQSKLESKRDSDEVISRTKPNRERVLRMSEDRNRIVWSEDEKIIFRDIPNPLVKTITLKEAPFDYRISNNAEFTLVSFRLKNTKGCRMKAISLLNDDLDFDSGAHIACRNSGGITKDGSYIYYFIDESLYKEKTTTPRKPIKIIDSSKIVPPFPKLRNKYSLIPIKDDFLLITGIAGSYNLYYLITKSDSIELISSDIMSPKVFYGNGSSVFVISGKIGILNLREVDYANNNKPKINKGFTISLKEIEPWKTSNKTEFISFYNNSVFRWGPMSKKKDYPILCEKAWGVGRDYLVYENKLGELVLSNTTYTDEEWAVGDLFKKVKKELR
jgi:hypothetical protein